MNIRLMKTVDSYFGRIAAFVLPVPIKTDGTDNLSSILLIRPGGIGDAALLAPAIRHLRQLFPDVQITILAERRNAAVFNLITNETGSDQAK